SVVLGAFAYDATDLEAGIENRGVAELTKNGASPRYRACSVAGVLPVIASTVSAASSALLPLPSVGIRPFPSALYRSLPRVIVSTRRGPTIVTRCGWWPIASARSRRAPGSRRTRHSIGS